MDVAYSQVKNPLKLGQINYVIVVSNNFPLIITVFLYKTTVIKTYRRKAHSIKIPFYCHSYRIRERRIERPDRYHRNAMLKHPLLKSCQEAKQPKEQTFSDKQVPRRVCRNAFTNKIFVKPKGTFPPLEVAPPSSHQTQKGGESLQITQILTRKEENVSKCLWSSVC